MKLLVKFPTKGRRNKFLNVLKKYNYLAETNDVLFFNDGFKDNKLNILSILSKKYYNGFKYIYINTTENPIIFSGWVVHNRRKKINFGL